MCPMTYPHINNWIIFSHPHTLLKSHLRVNVMPILVKACPTSPHDRPNDRVSDTRWTVSPGRHKAQQQPSQGSFWPFPLRLNLKLCRFDPKSSDFSQFKPRNIIKTYPSQIIKSKPRKLEAREEKKVKNPSSKTPQVPAVPSPKPKYFSVYFITRYVGFHYWVPFTYWVPSFQSDFWFSYHD